MTIAERRITLEEFLALPEQKPALEYFEGRVTQKVSPKLRHGLVQGQIVQQSNQRIVPIRSGLAAPEIRITIGGVSRVPDVVIFRWDRIPRDPTGELLDDVVTVPDVVVEVISPGQTRRDQLARCHWYVAQGAQAALLVHPRSRWLDLVRANRAVLRLREGNILDLSDVIAGLILPVSELFALVSI